MDMPPPMCVRTMPTIRLPIINKSLMAHPIQFITYLAMGLYNSVTFQLNAFAGAQRVGSGCLSAVGYSYLPSSYQYQQSSMHFISQGSQQYIAQYSSRLLHIVLASGKSIRGMSQLERNREPSTTAAAPGTPIAYCNCILQGQVTCRHRYLCK